MSDAAAAPEAEEKPKKPIVKIILAVVALVVLVAGTMVATLFITGFFNKPVPTADQMMAEGAAPDGGHGAPAADGHGAPKADAHGAPAGSRFGRLVGKLPARRVPEALDRVLSLWERERTTGEKLEEFLARVPVDAVKKAIGELFAIDEASATEADFIDPGQTVAFSVSEGEAECAA